MFSKSFGEGPLTNYTSFVYRNILLYINKGSSFTAFHGRIYSPHICHHSCIILPSFTRAHTLATGKYFIRFEHSEAALALPFSNNP